MHFSYYRLYYANVIRGHLKITLRFWGEGVEEFVTVQTQNFSFFRKLVTKGGRKGVKKVSDVQHVEAGEL